MGLPLPVRLDGENKDADGLLDNPRRVLLLMTAMLTIVGVRGRRRSIFFFQLLSSSFMGE
jgi:hypothetical protein